MSLINELIEKGYLRTPGIITAFRKVKRVDFVPETLKMAAETDMPLPLGYGQTISQPLTVALMFELLQPMAGETVLDVGSGSGWTVALLSEIVQEGKVYGLEIIPELCELAKTNVDKYGFIKNNSAKIFCRDGWLGLPEFAPFDKIIVAAAASELPEKLLEQLRVGGRLVLPIGLPGKIQNLILITKINQTNYEQQVFPGFSFVPLVKNN